MPASRRRAPLLPGATVTLLLVAACELTLPLPSPPSPAAGPVVVSWGPHEGFSEDAITFELAAPLPAGDTLRVVFGGVRPAEASGDGARWQVRVPDDAASGAVTVTSRSGATTLDEPFAHLGLGHLRVGAISTRQSLAIETRIAFRTPETGQLFAYSATQTAFQMPRSGLSVSVFGSSRLRGLGMSGDRDRLVLVGEPIDETRCPGVASPLSVQVWDTALETRVWAACLPGFEETGLLQVAADERADSVVVLAVAPAGSAAVDRVGTIVFAPAAPIVQTHEWAAGVWTQALAWSSGTTFWVTSDERLVRIDPAAPPATWREFPFAPDWWRDAEGGRYDAASALAASADRLVVGSVYGGLHGFDLVDGVPASRFVTWTLTGPGAEERDGVTGLALSPSGHLAATQGGRDSVSFLSWGEPPAYVASATVRSAAGVTAAADDTFVVGGRGGAHVFGARSGDLIGRWDVGANLASARLRRRACGPGGAPRTVLEVVGSALAKIFPFDDRTLAPLDDSDCPRADTVVTGRCGTELETESLPNRDELYAACETFGTSFGGLVRYAADGEGSRFEAFELNLTYSEPGWVRRQLRLAPDGSALLVLSCLDGVFEPCLHGELLVFDTAAWQSKAPERLAFEGAPVAAFGVDGRVVLVSQTAVVTYLLGGGVGGAPVEVHRVPAPEGTRFVHADAARDEVFVATRDAVSPGRMSLVRVQPLAGTFTEAGPLWPTHEVLALAASPSGHRVLLLVVDHDGGRSLASIALDPERRVVLGRDRLVRVQEPDDLVTELLVYPDGERVLLVDQSRDELVLVE